MMSKNLLSNIILYILVICLTCFGICYVTVFSSYKPLLFIVVPLLVVEIILFVRYINKTNRRMAYFIDAIRNDDTSVLLPKDIKNKAIADLYNSLGFLNEKMKKTKIEISYSEQLLKTLIENSASGFITITESGDFEVLNQNARKYLNIEHTSNLNRLKEQKPQLYHIFTTIKPGEKRVHRITRDENIFILSISVSEIKYRDSSFKVVSLQDISRELDEQELESWHKLFRVITHEIMNSIAPITSLANKLSSYFHDNGKNKQPEQLDEKTINNTIKGLNVIDDMSNGLMVFVENYRQLNKVPTPKIEKINLHDWLSKLKVLMLEIVNEKDIDLKISLAKNCNFIMADEKLMNQVLLNLVKNSYHAIENKGSINININLSDSGKTLINVVDSGSGIDEETLEKVFVPFYTTKDDGNGIGLSLSKQIIKLHGGQITMQSEVGKGTKVIVSL